MKRLAKKSRTRSLAAPFGPHTAAVREGRPVDATGQPVLRLYILGPGIGESLLLHLPCGGWGVVDCYETKHGGTLQRLGQLGARELKFLCFTHPHEDHYLGGHKLLDHYHGKIQQLWLPPGLTRKDLINLGLAAEVRHTYVGCLRARKMAKEYVKLLQAIIRERAVLNHDTYRRIVGSYPLIEDPLYRIETKGPSAITFDTFLTQLANIMVHEGPLVFTDEGGDAINSISVVLQITFGKSTVFLLADAQSGHDLVCHRQRRGYTLVKLAHHGSDNGRGYKQLTQPRGPHFSHGVVTPYLPSGLPREKMLQSYRKGCADLVETNARNSSGTPQILPGLPPTARKPSEEMLWTVLDVTSDGRVKRSPQKP